MIRLYLTVFEAGEGGPAVKNRLEGDAEMHKELLNRESLRADSGVKYFWDTFGHRFIKGPQSAFLSRFLIDFPGQEEKTLRWSSGSASSLCSISV